MKILARDEPHPIAGTSSPPTPPAALYALFPAGGHKKAGACTQEDERAERSSARAEWDAEGGTRGDRFMTEPGAAEASPKRTPSLGMAAAGGGW